MPGAGGQVDAARAADIIRTKRDEILHRWSERARILFPAAREQPQATLLDSLPVALSELADALAEETPGGEMRFRERVLGRAHGISRAMTEDYGLDQVIAEYDLLRRVLLDVLAAEGPLAPQVRATVLDATQAGVRNAAEEFVRERERERGTAEARAREIAGKTAERERMFSAMLDATPDYVYVCDPEGRFQFLNRAGAEAFARPREEILGHSLKELGARPDFLAHWDRNLARALAGERVVQDAPWERPDGVRRLEYSLDPVRGEDGKVDGVVGFTRDVTEHERAAATLRESQQQLSMALDAARMGTFDWDPQNDRLSLTNRAAELFGLSPDGEPRTSVAAAELIHPDDRDAHRRCFAEAHARGKDYVSEYRVVRPSDGRIVWIEERGSTVRDPLTGRIGVKGIHWDITARREAERALRESEAERERFFQLAPDMFCVARLDGYLERVNRAFVETLGRPEAELLSHPFLDFVHPDDVAATRAHLARLFRETNPCRFELRCVRGDGSFRWLSWTITAVRATGLAYASGRDISEQRAAEAALREREREYRMLAESMPQVVWTAGPDGRIDYVNQVLAAYEGRSVEAALGVAWVDIVHPDDVPPTTQRWERAVRSGEPYEAEFRIRRADGAFRWFLARAVALKDEAGRVRKWFGTATDIDDMKRAQAELSARADFEQKLIGIVSHDLRNPLQSVLMNAGALLRRDDLDERALRAALRIHASAERAGRMIRDLLDFTQARLGGGIPIRRAPADLHAIVQQALPDAEAGHPGRTVVVRHHGDARGAWDPDRLAQLVVNLVSNALKYSPENSPVVVETQGDGERVFLSVHNEGPPIPRERLGLIFEPLQRATNQVDSAGRSVGLGLYIVQQIVLAHGGAVTVRSGAGEGTTVTVALPRGRPAIASEEAYGPV